MRRTGALLEASVGLPIRHGFRHPYHSRKDIVSGQRSKRLMLAGVEEHRMSHVCARCGMTPPIDGDHLCSLDVIRAIREVEEMGAVPQ